MKILISRRNDKLKRIEHEELERAVRLELTITRFAIWRLSRLATRAKSLPIGDW
jgi:hypothetical protein